MWAITGFDAVTGELFASPQCDECFALYASPTFIEAVASVALEHPDVDGTDAARKAVTTYHNRGHRHLFE
jgi:hypothetical protein